MPKRIVCAGSLNVDISFTVERLPREHEKLRCDSARVTPGGSAANTAHWLAGMGGDTTMLGSVGTDPFGPWCIAALAAAGVEVAHIQCHPASTTGVATIFINPHSKRMLTAGGANLCFDPRRVPSSVFGGDVHLHVATSIREMALALLRLAKSAGATTSCDLDGLADSEMLPLVDYCFVNHTDLRRAHGPVEPREAWRDLASEVTLVVTRGAQGAIAVNGLGEYSAPAFPAEVVDRTGGGDAFDAGFLYGLSRGQGLPDCLRLGLRLAARVITTEGARPASVSLADLDAE